MVAEPAIGVHQGSPANPFRSLSCSKQTHKGGDRALPPDRAMTGGSDKFELLSGGRLWHSCAETALRKSPIFIVVTITTSWPFAAMSARASRLVAATLAVARFITGIIMQRILSAGVAQARCPLRGRTRSFGLVALASGCSKSNMGLYEQPLACRGF